MKVGIFPKLIYYTAFKIGIFDTSGVLIRLILSATTIYLLCNISKVTSPCMSYILLFLVFSSSFQHKHTANFGLQFITAVPSLCIILIIYLNKYLNDTLLNITFTAALCFISTFSYSNGIIIWVICVLLYFIFLASLV